MLGNISLYQKSQIFKLKNIKDYISMMMSLVTDITFKCNAKFENNKQCPVP